MASVEIYSDRILIRLSRAERILALRRTDVLLDRTAITTALITDDPMLWVRGVRAPGLRAPGGFALGTWRGSGGRDFVLARPGRPAVVIDFDGEAIRSPKEHGFDEFSRVVLSTNHAADLVQALRGDEPEAVFDAGASV